MKNKAQRREEAAERQAERDSRSNSEQVALLATRPGESKKEVARLSK